MKCIKFWKNNITVHPGFDDHLSTDRSWCRPSSRVRIISLWLLIRLLHHWKNVVPSAWLGPQKERHLAPSHLHTNLIIQQT